MLPTLSNPPTRTPTSRLGSKPLRTMSSHRTTALFGDLKNHVQTGWEKMKFVDDRPTRLYMTFTCKSSTDLGIQKTPLPTNVVNWCETFDKSTSGITTRLRRLVWKRLLLVDNLGLIHQPHVVIHGCLCYGLFYFATPRLLKNKMNVTLLLLENVKTIELYEISELGNRT
ncbi:uncharacterized protein LACBIDRAFT_303349 [Laccaria bicolor S238N-H82]|uniref:Predicted protein n=1 Tax=Laccaria bicolor (strain S238N-H82 / ATCC MYA-4686) TaxID=486041 RepID=B0DJD0_LACBS|nr:uncharacterized protein LACBIDRAFT_303349 [Laccaria bicolor S238N-H82]EDR05497.1 predicted protein [Laccaria bicolor S238N-H82]|eukprot:XP_001884055.1 predicted protein [Laccaria bicolor S238N-H82]